MHILFLNDIQTITYESVVYLFSTLYVFLLVNTFPISLFYLINGNNTDNYHQIHQYQKINGIDNFSTYQLYR